MLFKPFSALHKILGFKHAVGQAQRFKPRAIAALALLCRFAIEVFYLLGVVTRVAERACALVLAGYCADTAVLCMRCWAQSIATKEEPTAPAMPAFGWQLTDAEIAAVTSYIGNSWSHAAPVMMYRSLRTF